MCLQGRRPLLLCIVPRVSTPKPPVLMSRDCPFVLRRRAVAQAEGFGGRTFRHLRRYGRSCVRTGLLRGDPDLAYAAFTLVHSTTIQY
jgi:hypothetical protein